MLNKENSNKMNNNKFNYVMTNYSSRPTVVTEHPVRDSLYIVIPLTIVYSIIFLTGMLGNIITCVVISRNKSMHTATNYYLFSLAVSDLLLLLSGLPQEIYNMWYRYPYPFNEAICVLQGFAAETSANATVLTITAFTIERYVAICHPFLSHTMSKLSRAVKFVLGIWLVAMCLAIPQILDLGITHHKTCTVKRGMTEGINKHVFTISTFLVFVFPMIVISVLYILIGLQLRRSKVVKRGNACGSSVRIKHDKFMRTTQRTVVAVDQTPPTNLMPSCSLSKFPTNICTTTANNNQIIVEQNQINSPEDGRINYSNKAPQNHGSRHVVNMLVAVVVAFFICWAPHHAQRLFAIYGDEQNYSDESLNKIYYCITYVSGVLYFVSTCINPFLYNLMSHKFREAFKDTLAKYMYRRRGIQSRQGRFTRNPSQHSNSNSHSANTCSSVCSNQHNHNNYHSLRYLEKDLANIKGTKRPLVVSFKRIPRDKLNSLKNINDIDSNYYNGRSSDDDSKLCKNCEKLLINDQNQINSIGSSSMNNMEYCKLCKEDGKLCKLNKNPISVSFYPNDENVIINRHHTDNMIMLKPVQNSLRCKSNTEINSNSLKLEHSLGSENYPNRFSNNCDSTASQIIQPHFSDNISSILNTHSDFYNMKERESFNDQNLNIHDGTSLNIYKHNSERSILKNDGNNTQKNNLAIFRTMHEKAQKLISRQQNNNTKKDIPIVTYKSPYDSPEMSVNCKQLEENLQHILEDLIIYPKNEQHKRKSFLIESTKNSEELYYNPLLLRSRNKILTKSKSLPSLSHFIEKQANLTTSDTNIYLINALVQTQ